MACGDPRTCLHCALADLVRERIASGAVTPLRAFDDVQALVADLIAADEEGARKHARLIEQVQRDIGPNVTLLRNGGWPCGGYRPRIAS